MKEMLDTALKGLIIGGTMLVPGVSGGTIAMILGIYDKLISAVSSLFKNLKKNVFFLGLFSIAALLGMFLFAQPLSHLIEKFPMATRFFFMGTVIGGIPLIVKSSQVKKFSWKWIICILCGFFVVFLFSFLPAGNVQTNVDISFGSFMVLFFSGIVGAIALVLPGISISYMFLMMGLYDELMKAISKLYFPFLIPLGIGLIAGTLLIAKILEKAMTKYPQYTYLIILGFVLGSITEVFPGVPTGWDIPICLLTLAAGVGAIQLLDRATS